MAKKTKETASKTTTSTPTTTKTVTAPVVTAPVTTTAATPKVSAPVAAPVATPVKTVTPVVAAAPVKTETPVAAKTVTTPVTTSTNGNGNGNGHTPVAVQLKKAGAAASVKAVIRYQGPLASKSEKLLAVVGMEWFGGARWQGSKDVEMKKSRDGAFEAELELTDKDATTGQALMALQLAFTTPTRTNWDSGGVPYGYYQVSALNGHVETVPHVN